MSDKNSAVAIVESHNRIEDAARGLHNNGSDVTKLPNADKPIQVGVPGKYWVTAGVLALCFLWRWRSRSCCKSGCGCGNSITRVFSGRCFPSSGEWVACFHRRVSLPLDQYPPGGDKQLRAAPNATRQRNAGSGEKTRGIEIGGFVFSGRVVLRSLPLIAAAVAAIFALGFFTQWDTYLRFRYGGSCGFSDPVFGIDAGFYLFTSSVLSAPAIQSRIFDGAGDRRRR